MQVLRRVLFSLRAVSPRRASHWGSTSRTHLCLRFKGSRRLPRSHLRRLSLPSLSQTLRLISALLGFRISSGLKSSLSLKFNSRNRILRLRYMTCPFHPLKPKHARLHFRSHPFALLLLQRRRHGAKDSECVYQRSAPSFPGKSVVRAPPRPNWRRDPGMMVWDPVVAGFGGWSGESLGAGTFSPPLAHEPGLH